MGIGGLLGLMVTVPGAQATAPLPPMLLQGWSDGETIFLSWEEPQDVMEDPVAGYNVYLLSDGVPMKVWDGTDLSYEYRIPEGGPTTEWFVYYVTAFNGDGESPPSNPAVVGKSFPRCALVDGEPPLPKPDCLVP